MKKLNNYVAETILLVLAVIALSSCSLNNKAEAQEYNTIDCVDCFTIEDYYSSLDCENCDEID